MVDDVTSAHNLPHFVLDCFTIDESLSDNDDVFEYPKGVQFETATDGNQNQKLFIYPIWSQKLIHTQTEH